MNDKEILEIAQYKGYFVASDDEELRKQCIRLVQKGLLRRDKLRPSDDYFTPSHPAKIEKYFRHQAMLEEHRLKKMNKRYVLPPRPV